MITFKCDQQKATQNRVAGRPGKDYIWGITGVTAGPGSQRLSPPEGKGGARDKPASLTEPELITKNLCPSHCLQRDAPTHFPGGKGSEGEHKVRHTPVGHICPTPQEWDWEFTRCSLLWGQFFEGTLGCPHMAPETLFLLHLQKDFRVATLPMADFSRSWGAWLGPLWV